jgi:hypothetical protein
LFSAIAPSAATLRRVARGQEVVHMRRIIVLVAVAAMIALIALIEHRDLKHWEMTKKIELTGQPLVSTLLL